MARPSPTQLRVLAIVLVATAAAALGTLLLTGGDDGRPRRLAPGTGATGGASDPLAYDQRDDEELQRRAAAGLAHVLYAKSPGGVLLTAQRVARWRGLIERAARRDGAAAALSPDVLEAIVFLESAGRADARASDDLDGAVGLTQILAQTGRDLLGMKVDVRAAQRLTRGIRRGHRVRARVRARRAVDERFDAAKSLQGTARYLRIALAELGGREDLAVASYHMGIGNLQTALRRYGEGNVPYVRLYFDTTPAHKPEAFAFLASLGDDSSTYLWRVRAAQQIMALWRADPRQLGTLAALQTAKNSAEEVLHPPQSTTVFGDPFELGRARAAGTLRALLPGQLARFGVRIDPRMGELARLVKQSPRLYHALAPPALALLAYIGAGVRELGGSSVPLTVTSAVRDAPYQRALMRRNIEATRRYSLHTTGFAFDISRDYATPRQARALQFFLDRLTALDLIAWVREPGAIHVTVSSRAASLLSVLADDMRLHPGGK